MAQQQTQQPRPHASRLNLARAAIRPMMKGRVMLSGPPGAGKTYTGLVIASALVGPDGRILVIDTEKESALTYADHFSFDALRWNPPFDPTDLAHTLREASDAYDCVIVDSFSHFWRKQGGVLDIAGGKITGWDEARPIQENLIETLLDIDAHVIVACRSKMDHLIEQVGGKQRVTKMGLKAQQDDDLEYEVNVALEVSMAHVLSVSKSRTNAVPTGTEYLAGQAGDFAIAYRDWLRGGEPVAAKADTDALAEALNRVGDDVERKRAKNDFKNIFGRPEFLLVSRLGEAQEWVADRILGIAAPVDRAEGDEPADKRGEEGGAPAPPARGRQAKPPAAPPAPAPATGSEAAPDPDGILAAVTAEYSSWGVTAVTDELKRLGISRNGTNPVVRARLIAHVVAERRKAAAAGAGEPEAAGAAEPEAHGPAEEDEPVGEPPL